MSQWTGLSESAALLYHHHQEIAARSRCGDSLHELNSDLRKGGVFFNVKGSNAAIAIFRENEGNNAAIQLPTAQIPIHVPFANSLGNTRFYYNQGDYEHSATPTESSHVLYKPCRKNCSY